MMTLLNWIGFYVLRLDLQNKVAVKWQEEPFFILSLFACILYNQIYYIFGNFIFLFLISNIGKYYQFIIILCATTSKPIFRLLHSF